MRLFHLVDFYFLSSYLLHGFLYISVYNVSVIAHIADVFLHMHIAFIVTFVHSTSFIFSLLIILSCNEEIIPGPLPLSHRQCLMLYSNI